MNRINQSSQTPRMIRYENANPTERQKRVRQEENNKVLVNQDPGPKTNDSRFPLGSQIDTKA